MKQAVDYNITDLLRVMQCLRDPESGCPWDLAQNFQTIVPSTLEECYELADAIEREDYPHVADELGDVLFQVVFYARLGEEQAMFDFGQVVDGLVKKLLRRHPHVFANGDLETVVGATVSAAQVGKSWEAIKAEERQQREQKGTLDDVPVSLPALSRAQKVQKRAANAGFDWPDVAPVMDKLYEEMSELKQAIANGTVEQQEDELGDLLFSCVNMARHLDIDAQRSLRSATRKFERRFTRVEEQARELGRSLDDFSHGELDALWENAKKSQ